MRFTFLFLFATLILGAFASVSFIPNAEALTAATFANQATFTDTGLSEYWQTVYTITNSSWTYFVDSNSTHIKAVRLGPTGTVLGTVTATLPATGVSHVSGVETTGAQHRVFFAQLNSGTSAYVGYANIDTGAVTSQAVTITDTGETPVEVVTTKNRIYYMWCCTVNNFDSSYTDRSLAGFTWQDNIGFATNADTKPVVVCETLTDGASSATDLIYCVNEANDETFRVQKNLGGTWTDKGTRGTGVTTTEVQGVAVNGIFIARGSTSSIEDTATISVSTDTLSAVLYTDNWLTVPTQTSDFDGTTRTWKSSNFKAYLATTTKAVSWTPAGTNLNPDELYLESVNNSTGTLTAVDDAKYYRISDTLIVSGSGSTWTPRLITAALIEPTPYSENLDVPLVVNSTLLRDADLIDLVCDSNYQWRYASAYHVGNDDDCTGWRVHDVSTNTIGRDLLYASDKGLVHTPEYTNYNIHVTSTEGTADEFYAKIKYTNVEVDTSQFDGGNNAQLRLLYGQCYDLEFIESLTGDVVHATNVCADDVIFKEAILSATLGFTFWNSPWGTIPSWNDTSNILSVTVRHEPFPYNWTVNIYNKTNDLIVTSSESAAAEVDSASFNLTAYANDCAIGVTTCHNPFRLEVLDDDGTQRHQSYFDTGNDYLFTLRQSFGAVEFNGWGILLFIPIIFAAAFTRNTAGIGGALLVTMIGTLVFFGVLDPSIFSPLIIGVLFFIAIVGLLAYRILYS